MNTPSSAHARQPSRLRRLVGATFALFAAAGIGVACHVESVRGQSLFTRPPPAGTAPLQSLDKAGPWLGSAPLGQAADDRPARFRVTVDGRAPQTDHGADTDAQGMGMVDKHRLYQLLRRQPSDRPTVFQIEFLDPGVQAYAFTFG